jgi:Protein of unknown function (DUF3102)
MIQVEIILQECVEEIRRRKQSILSDCFEIGKQLTKARDALRQWGGDDHEGKWQRWLEQDVQISDQQALNYIRVYERYGQETIQLKIDFNLAPVSHTVLAVLAAPNADPQAVEEIEKEIIEGQKFTVKQVKARVPSVRKAKSKKKRCEPKLKPKPIAPDDAFLIDFRESIVRMRKEANDVKNKNKQWSHHGINITRISAILDWVVKTLDDKIEELTRAAS